MSRQKRKCHFTSGWNTVGDFHENLMDDNFGSDEAGDNVRSWSGKVNVGGGDAVDASASGGVGGYCDAGGGGGGDDGGDSSDGSGDGGDR